MTIESAELVDELFNTRLRHLIEAIVLRILVGHSPDRVADAVTSHAAERAEDDDLQKTIMAEESAMGHRAGNEQRDIAFDGTQREDRVNTVLLDYLGQMIHKEEGERLVWALKRVTFES